MEVVFLEVIFARARAGTFSGVCRLGCDLDRCLLEHLAHWGHFETRLHDVVGGALPLDDGVVAGAHLASCGIGGDSCEVGVTAASFATGELVVGAVAAGLGVDDESAAGQGVESHVDKTGAGHDGTCRSKRLVDPSPAKKRCDLYLPAQQKKVMEGVLPFAVAIRPAASGSDRTI